MIRKFLIAAAALAIPAAAVASPSAVFLRKAIDGNYSEVMLGRQIQARGASGQVRNFGAMLVRDHGKGLAQAQQIADRKNVRHAAAMTPEARHEMKVLRRLSGRSFDREVRRYMINDHIKDIAEFKAQVRSGDRATSGYAAATVPVMQHHLSVARSIRG
jgi:putative membrane protein